MWKRAVRCEFEGEDGRESQRQSVGTVCSQDRLRSCGGNGTLGGGPVHAQRGQDQLVEWSLICPHLLSNNPTSQSSS